ncbi:MAG: cystathionine beta-synthase [Chlorobi bacterium OLB6]|nr:MAG: cystathionine beta-synthase [Chlorobi bacterium OLB6]
MNVKHSILELVGNTPLLKLTKVTSGIAATVLAKMESKNPGGSIKDRIGIAMIEAAEREGKLSPGDLIIDLQAATQVSASHLLPPKKVIHVCLLQPTKHRRNGYAT